MRRSERLQLSARNILKLMQLTLKKFLAAEDGDAAPHAVINRVVYKLATIIVAVAECTHVYRPMYAHIQTHP